MSGRTGRALGAVLAALLIVASLPNVAHALIATVSGQIIKIAPPANASSGATTNPTNIVAWDERQGVTLASPLRVNIVAAGVYNDSADLVNGTIATGTVVDSHMLHSDKPANSGEPLRAGTVTFPTNILGVLVETGPKFTDSDILGSPGTIYPVGPRGLELGGQGDLVVLPDLRTLQVTTNTFGSVDEVRVITRHNSPPVVNARGPYAGTEGSGVALSKDQTFEADKIADTLHVDNDTVIPVDSGITAMEYAGQHEFDLIIVSLNLKKEDGLRLCSHLRSNERTRATPILMMATESDMTKIAHGLEIGAHDYILRPIDRNELLARARTQVRRKRFQARLKANYEVSLSMALTDALTGLYNRRYLEVYLQKLLQKNFESKKKLCVLMLDIDKFKNINDTHGHGVGDEVLKTFAFRLQDSLRSFDLVARLGGEEFVVILPDITDDMAQFVSERLRRSIADKPIKCSIPDGALNVSTSIGGYIVEHGEHTVKDVLEHADKMLYDAKHGGRNCTVFEKFGKLDPEKFKQEPRAVIE